MNRRGFLGSLIAAVAGACSWESWAKAEVRQSTWHYAGGPWRKYVTPTIRVKFDPPLSYSWLSGDLDVMGGLTGEKVMKDLG